MDNYSVRFKCSCSTCVRGALHRGWQHTVIQGTSVADVKAQCRQQNPLAFEIQVRVK